MLNNVEELHKSFYYKGGELYWKESSGNAAKGDVAGSINNKGYRAVQYLGRKHQAARLILLMFGHVLTDKDRVIYKDGNKLNLSIDNLGVSTHSAVLKDAYDKGKKLPTRGLQNERN